MPMAVTETNYKHCLSVTLCCPV